MNLIRALARDIRYLRVSCQTSRIARSTVERLRRLDEDAEVVDRRGTLASPPPTRSREAEPAVLRVTGTSAMQLISGALQW